MNDIVSELFDNEYTPTSRREEYTLHLYLHTYNQLIYIVEIKEVVKHLQIGGSLYNNNPSFLLSIDTLVLLKQYSVFYFCFKQGSWVWFFGYEIKIKMIKKMVTKLIVMFNGFGCNYPRILLEHSVPGDRYKGAYVSMCIWDAMYNWRV